CHEAVEILPQLLILAPSGRLAKRLALTRSVSFADFQRDWEREAGPMRSRGFLRSVLILQRPAPSMQHTEEAEAIGANKSRVRGQGAQRLAGSLEQGGAHHVLMASGQRAQLGRQREGDQKVGARQQAVGLLLEPGLDLLVLAGRAMPV